MPDVKNSHSPGPQFPLNSQEEVYWTQWWGGSKPGKQPGQTGTLKFFLLPGRDPASEGDDM